jgi:hypothetical protein
MKRAILVAAAAVLALAACSKKADTAATGAATPTVAAAPSLTPPTRKAGLWEQTMTLERSSGAAQPFMQGTKMCLDEASEAKMKWWATENRRGKSECAEQAITPRLGGGWSFHSVCSLGDGAKVTADGQATGDFGSHYKVDITSVTSGSAMAQSNGTHKMTIEATWKGPCPAGMKGGDIEMPGGMRVNMVDAAGRAAAAPEGFKPGQRPTPEQMAQMRAQAMEMAKRMKAGEAK